MIANKKPGDKLNYKEIVNILQIDELTFQDVREEVWNGFVALGISGRSLQEQKVKSRVDQYIENQYKKWNAKFASIPDVEDSLRRCLRNIIRQENQMEIRKSKPSTPKAGPSKLGSETHTSLPIRSRSSTPVPIDVCIYPIL